MTRTVTTIVQVQSAIGSNQASGFFYNRLGPADPKVSGPQWRAMEKTWLVTNRHVVLSRARVNLSGQFFIQELLPETLTFSIGKAAGLEDGVGAVSNKPSRDDESEQNVIRS
jgi:hypothetical protein